MISVIIPILNEAKILERSLSKLGQQLQRHQLIIVDGGSTDGSLCIAKKFGQILSSSQGRARQMNAGAAVATGDILLFLHADAWLEAGAIKGVEAAITTGYVGGAFKQRIEGGHILYRLIERAANFRAQRLQLFYGDGGIFISKRHFHQIGGFPNVPILEEMEFSRKLQYLGKTTLVEPGIHISSRRWKKNGIVRTTALNWFITALYSLGVSPTRLARLYRHIR
ncbi:MAG: TIGR04283 family arsenosugar biosynthesis glycosyltransferase [Candidatus Poribacteria bacterium]|nr:TIGR04283 family arsenosugar biosynthesis glycosyltransferase [Candidatus Poribacteria bacterium]